MDVLVQKPKGSIKIWTIVGIIAIIVFYVCYVFIDMYVAQASSTAPAALDYIGLFMNFNGLFVTAVLVFLIGLFVSKKRNFFLKLMLWTMMLTGFYFSMPAINNLGQFFTSYSGLELMYYIGLVLPQILICVLLVSAIVQKDSQNAGATNMIAWLCIVVDVLLFIFQLVYVFSNAQNMASISTVSIALPGAIAIVVLICLSFIILTATKTTAVNGKQKEVVLDNLVEKIAQEPKKAEANLEDMVEKISRDDD